VIRATLLWFHRYAALVAGAVLLVVAASGAAIVFEGAIDRALNPRLSYVSTSGNILPLDTLVARARAAAGNAPVTGMSLAPVAGRSYVVSAGPNAVYVNPYTGDVLGIRTPAERDLSLARRLHLLHVRLLGGRAASEVVGIATLVALVVVLTGLVVWWRDRLWRIQWSASWKRVTFDLHHALGVFAWVVLIVITASGVVIHYDTFGKLIGRLDRLPASPPAKQPAAAGATAIGWDSAAAIAHAALPGATLMFLSAPPPRDAPITAAMRFTEDRTPGGRSRVTIDRYRGLVLRAESTRDAQLGTRLNNLKRSLHTGDVLGKPTEAVWLVAALVLASQVVTGVLMWWNSRASRKAARARQGDHATG
jgi:uncharacterized iron-regulated membrane protein